MVSVGAVLGVAAVALGLVLTPGPNMIYLVSRSISQGRAAGMVSLGGVAVGFLCYLMAAAVGLASLFQAVPAAYHVVKIAGAAYLGFLAWQTLRPGGRSAFETYEGEGHSRRRLFTLGLVTNLLNPKIALLYAALLPQFVSPDHGPVWQQFLQLGAVQIVVAVTVNALIVLTASAIAVYLVRHPAVLRAQRWGSGTLLGAFAVKMAFSHAPARP
ncbi:MAG: LysE family translocator [Nocardioidaceae bacterium]